MAFTQSTILALTPVASFQSLGDGAVILLTDSGQMHTCNETTEMFLGAVDGKRSIADIIDVALKEFEVDRETLRADFLALAADLANQGIVKVV